MDAYLVEVGEYLDVIWLGDDSCTQRGPYISPGHVPQAGQTLFHRVRPPDQEQDQSADRASLLRVVL